MDDQRTYRIAPEARWFARGTALCLVAIALVGTVGQSTGVIHRSLTPADFVLADTLFVGLAMLMWLGADRRVIMDANAIQVTGILGTRRLGRDEIRGRCMRKGGRYGGVYYYVMLPTDRTRRALKLPLYLKTDRWFHDWMKSIPQVKE